MKPKHIYLLVVECLPTKLAIKYSDRNVFHVALENGNQTLGFKHYNEFDGDVIVLCIISDDESLRRSIVDGVKFMDEPCALIAFRILSPVESKELYGDFTTNWLKWNKMENSGEFLLAMIADYITDGCELDTNSIINYASYRPMFSNYTGDTNARERSMIKVYNASVHNPDAIYRLEQMAICPAQTKEHFAALQKIACYERDVRFLHQERWRELMQYHNPDKDNADAHIYMVYVDAKKVSDAFDNVFYQPNDFGRCHPVECNDQLENFPVAYVVSSSNLLISCGDDTGGYKYQDLVDGKECEIVLSLCVLPHFRRMGIGSALLRHLMLLLDCRIELIVPESCAELQRMLKPFGMKSTILSRENANRDLSRQQEDMYVFWHDAPAEAARDLSFS